MGEVIAGKCQLKLMGDQDVNVIDGESILKAQETNKIRELDREICAISDTPSETELRKKQEIETECESLEEIKEVNSADQMDPLNDVRFKMQTGNKNLPRGRSDGILGNETPGMGEEIPKEATSNKYGDAAGEIGIWDIRKHVDFAGNPLPMYRKWSP